MAKTHGAQHAKGVTGTVSGITHRVYRGTGIASVHKMVTTHRPWRFKLTNPQELAKVKHRWYFGSQIEVRWEGGVRYIINMDDVKGTTIRLSQPDPAKQYIYHPSDPLHNSRPYATSDGINDFMFSPDATLLTPQPLELWFVMQDLAPTGVFDVFISSQVVTTCWFFVSNVSPYPLAAAFGVQKVVAESKIFGLHIWRLVVNGTKSFLEIDGVQQTPNVNLGSEGIKKFYLTSRLGGLYFAQVKLFDFTICDGILNNVERAQLLNWFKEYYNL